MYHAELARQLCDFLSVPLQKHGMLPLPDVYCLYNRARGICTSWNAEQERIVESL